MRHICGDRERERNEIGRAEKAPRAQSQSEVVSVSVAVYASVCHCRQCAIYLALYYSSINYTGHLCLCFCPCPRRGRCPHAISSLTPSTALTHRSSVRMPFAPSTCADKPIQCRATPPTRIPCDVSS